MLFLALAISLVPLSASAQFQFIAPSKRYELGKRVNEVERLWDQVSDPELKLKAAKEMEAAVRQFFSLRLAGACRCLDRTYLVLKTGSQEIDPASAYLRSLSISIDKPLLAETEKTFGFKVSSMYKAPVPEGLVSVELKLVSAPADHWKSVVAGMQMSQLKDFLKKLPIASFAADDAVFELTLKNSSNKQVVVQRRFHVSVVKDLEQRLETLETWLKSNDETLVSETIREGLKAMKRAKSGQAREFHDQYNQYLSRLEQLSAGELQQQPGTMLLALPRSGRNLSTVRIFVPESAKDNPNAPIVFGLHGMGGSENMFFQTYGHGKILETCKQNGWILVSPRIGLIASVFDVEAMQELLKPYLGEADRPAVLVGHSMGASTIVRAMSKQPKSVKAIALISGGGRFSDVKALKSTPVYLSAGDIDFGRQITEITKKQLDGEINTLKYELLKNTEHMFVVTDSLPSVVKFFQKHLQTRNPKAKLY